MQVRTKAEADDYRRRFERATAWLRAAFGWTPLKAAATRDQTGAYGGKSTHSKKKRRGRQHRRRARGRRFP